jgi:uncharacterized protein (DUF3084 family)
MIGVNTPTLPPSVPTDQALMGALSLLASLGNAQTTAATLTQMAEHKQPIDDAIVANNAAAATATEKQAALSNLEARDADITAREAAVSAARTAVDVAAAAVKDRERGLTTRSAELDQREAEIAARAKALDDRLAAYRQALA